MAEDQAEWVAGRVLFSQRSANCNNILCPTFIPLYGRAKEMLGRPQGVIPHLPSDCRALANMKGASSYGLDRMPCIEPTLAGLILSPVAVLRPDVHCPWPQCRLTDVLVGKSYDAAARMARIGNSMSHLVLALSQTLQSPGADT